MKTQAPWFKNKFLETADAQDLPPGRGTEANSSGIPCLWFPAPKAATVILFFHANADAKLQMGPGWDTEEKNSSCEITVLKK